MFTSWCGLNIYILFSSIQASKENALLRTMSRTPERRGLGQRGVRHVCCVSWPDFTAVHEEGSRTHFSVLGAHSGGVNTQ